MNDNYQRLENATVVLREKNKKENWSLQPA